MNNTRRIFTLCTLAVSLLAGAPMAHAQDKNAVKPEDKAAVAAKAELKGDLADANAVRRSRVIAQGTGFSITIGDVEDSLAPQSPYLRAKYTDKAQLKELVESMVQFELMAQEAKRRGYDADPTVTRSSKQNAVQLMIRKVIDGTVTKEGIPAADVKAYYDSHHQEFNRDGLVRASHILVGSKKRAQELTAEAKKADTRAFRELAQKESIDTETKLRGGDLQYFNPQGIPMVLLARYGTDLTKVPDHDRVDLAIAKAAFLLKNVGDVSPPVPVGTNWSLVRLTGKRAAESRSLADSDEGIRNKLWRERRTEALEALVTKLSAEFKPAPKAELLAPLKFEAPAPAAPGDRRGPGLSHGHGAGDGHGH